MKSETHILDRNSACARCGTDLKPPMIAAQKSFAKARRGDRIGVISGMVIPDVAYRIQRQEFDTNQFCVPMKDSIP